MKANRSNLRDVCMLSHQKCRLTRSTRAPRQALKWKARTVVPVQTDGKYLFDRPRERLGDFDSSYGFAKGRSLKVQYRL